MKEFFSKNKKGIKIGLIVFFILIIVVSVWLFALPAFKTNKYGNRLDGINKHKISNDVISKIKAKSSDNDSVEKIDYHKEGRILNFIIMVDSNYGIDQAKEFANGILSEINDEDKKYYDIQVLIKTKDKSDVYPIIGYKSKNSDGFNYGNAGGNK